MSKKTSVEKLMSKQTIEKLDTALTKGNMEQLKKQMEKLFTYKNIFNMHDDHLIELAECIVDIANAEDRVKCATEIEQYARRRISKYQNRKQKAVNENQWAKAANVADDDTRLDLAYRVWVYESGFEYSKFYMYSMLRRIIDTILAHEKARETAK